MTDSEHGFIREEQEALLRVLEAIRSSATASDAYAVIAEEARALMKAGTAAIGLASPDSAVMDFVAVAGRDRAEIIGLRVATRDTLAHPALKSGRAMLLDAGVIGDMQAGAIAPIAGPSGPLGAIIVTEPRAGATFGERDLALLGLLATAAGLVMDCNRVTGQLREKQRELAALYDAARMITATVNLQSVLDSVLESISGHLPVQAAALYLLNDERTHLYIAADRGLSDDERETQLAADAGIAAAVLKASEGRILDDLHADPDADTVAPTDRARSLMTVPIRSATETLGVLTVTSSQPRAYRPEDLRLLEAVGTLAGIAIHNANLYEDATRRAEAASALFSFSQRAGGTLDVAEILACVAETTVNLLGVDKFAAMMMEYRHGRLIPRAMRGLDEASFAEYRPRAGEGIAGWVYQWACPTAVADVAADARDRSAPIHPFGVASCLAVPVASTDAVYGALLAMSSRRRLFTVSEMELLYTVANQAALAIANALAYQRAQDRALAMRRYFRRFASAIGTAMDRSQVLQLLTDVTLDVMEADRCSIYRRDGDELILLADSRLPGRGAPDARIAVGTGLTGEVAARGRALAVSPVAEDPRAQAHAWFGRERVASYLGLPIKSGRKVTGVVELLSSEPRTFAPDEIRLITQFIIKARLGERLDEETTR